MAGVRKVTNGGLHSLPLTKHERLYFDLKVVQSYLLHCHSLPRQQKQEQESPLHGESSPAVTEEREREREWGRKYVSFSYAVKTYIQIIKKEILL